MSKETKPIIIKVVKSTFLLILGIFVGVKQESTMTAAFYFVARTGDRREELELLRVKENSSKQEDESSDNTKSVKITEGIRVWPEVIGSQFPLDTVEPMQYL
uniref:Uncharacterized protein n=1 Tax=Vespula pensylvanica TaxID=30213 RepID=A0A834P2D3_VESPE|nr:hypothetical protein H0235_008041 [Vespula pensylvanica]